MPGRQPENHSGREKCGLGGYASAELFYDLDECMDIDYLFVFFGLPNFRVSIHQQPMLKQAVIRHRVS